MITRVWKLASCCLVVACLAGCGAKENPGRFPPPDVPLHISGNHLWVTEVNGVPASGSDFCCNDVLTYEGTFHLDAGEFLPPEPNCALVDTSGVIFNSGQSPQMTESSPGEFHFRGTINTGKNPGNLKLRCTYGVTLIGEARVAVKREGR